MLYGSPELTKVTQQSKQGKYQNKWTQGGRCCADSLFTHSSTDEPPGIVLLMEHSCLALNWNNLTCLQMCEWLCIWINQTSHCEKGIIRVIVLVYFDGPLLMFRVPSTKCFYLGKVKNDRDTEINWDLENCGTYIVLFLTLSLNLTRVGLITKP